MAQKVCDCGNTAGTNGYCTKCNQLLDMFVNKELIDEGVYLSAEEQEWAERPLPSLEEGDLPE